MKYMGSKHVLLKSGLGDLITKESLRSARIVDLFCGGAAVSWFAAEETALPVLAIDLQEYAIVLARSIVGRTKTVDAGTLSNEWFCTASRIRERSRSWQACQEFNRGEADVEQLVMAARELCTRFPESGPIWRAYGGHYFSPNQAATIDALIEALPAAEPMRTICLAATIASGSHCAASPGHTAQPFQPTEGAAPYIEEAWSRDPLYVANKALSEICSRRANVVGEAIVGDAVSMAQKLSATDLVIVDPPYSGVQYSRFYHVLETIARGSIESVAGTGRYPPLADRPQSAFSRSSESATALESLLKSLSQAGSTVILTHPAGQSSNGLSGEMVIDIATCFYDVTKRRVIGRFSTLGGNNSNRSARSKSDELMLLMKTKSSHKRN